MLVLCRQRDESVVFSFEKMTEEEFQSLRNSTVKVTVVNIRGDKVRLGFDAPRPVSVHRREVAEAIQREHEWNDVIKSKSMKAEPITVRKTRPGASGLMVPA